MSPVWVLAIHLARWTIFGVMALVVLRRRLPPGVSLAWLGLAYFLPEAGAILYFLLGDHRLGRKRVRLHRQLIHAMRTDGGRSNRRVYAMRPPIEPVLQPLVRQAERTTGMPIVGGNAMDLMPDNKTMIERLLVDIDAAKKSVHLLYYIYENDRAGELVTQALLRAQERGVACRVLADNAGSWAFFRSKLPARLTESGAKFPALPVAPFRKGLSRLDLRNHRKLAVIDGAIAYTGSQNIVSESYGPSRTGCWVDMSGRFTGPIVTELQTVFVEDWAYETDEVLSGDDVFPRPSVTGDIMAQAVPSGPGNEAEALPRVLVAAINMAQRRVLITTPYFAPDEPMMLALAMAVDRGAEVSIVLPGRSDYWLVSAAARSYYLSLMQSGIQIYHHNSGLLHAKTVSVDDSFAVIGSANMDIRSFYLCFELNVLLYGPHVTQLVRNSPQECYFAASVKLDMAQWKKRPFYKSLTENAAGLLSPLM